MLLLFTLLCLCILILFSQVSLARLRCPTLDKPMLELMLQLLFDRSTHISIFFHAQEFIKQGISANRVIITFGELNSPVLQPSNHPISFGNIYFTRFTTFLQFGSEYRTCPVFEWFTTIWSLLVWNLSHYPKT